MCSGGNGGVGGGCNEEPARRAGSGARVRACGWLTVRSVRRRCTSRPRGCVRACVQCMLEQGAPTPCHHLAGGPVFRTRPDMKNTIMMLISCIRCTSPSMICSKRAAAGKSGGGWRRRHGGRRRRHGGGKSAAVSKGVRASPTSMQIVCEHLKPLYAAPGTLQPTTLASTQQSASKASGFLRRGLTVTPITASPGAGHASAHAMATRKESGRKLSITKAFSRRPLALQSTIVS